MKEDTQRSTTVMIITLLKSLRHRKSKVFQRYNCLEVTAEFNPFKKLSDSYYYKLNKNYNLFDNQGKLTFSPTNVIDDFTVIFGKGKETNILNRALRNATNKISKEKEMDIFQLFVTEVWATDCKDKFSQFYS